MNKEVGWTHEFLFSLNCSWVWIWIERGRPSWPFLVERSPRLMRLYGSFRLSEPPTVLDQVMWSLVLGVLIFLVLRVIAHLDVTRFVLCTFAGGFALVAFPAFYLFFPAHALGPFETLRHPIALLVELVVVVVFGSLFYLKRFPIPFAASIVLLLLHFGLWACVTSSYVNVHSEISRYGLWNPGTWISTVFYCGFPVIGFLSTVAWGLYIRGIQDLASRPQ
jgi:hypothetical protein